MTILNDILEQAGLKNHALVEVFPGTLSHKTVQKARLGTRPISKKAEQKIVEALNKVLLLEVPYSKQDVFPKEL
ncbi:MAG: hypothetical protein UHC59_00805 [Fibrobacteraceae bacterium]|nr:hypothetical protein [Fibrobacteraceae bacterium]